MMEEELKQLSKSIVSFAFRNNTNLEDLHDRITDSEMRELMIASVNNIYTVFTLYFGLEGTKAREGIAEYLLTFHQENGWKEPQLDQSFIDSFIETLEAFKKIT